MGTVLNFEEVRAAAIADIQRLDRGTPVETVVEGLMHAAGRQGIPAEYVSNALGVVASIGTVEGGQNA